ncbi:MAG TPA: carboxypeptidase-like regulatory domain-containing protein [Terriglobia bacterium]|nr:carboxypeptidase-like regulatory domain-containing protein [Terriglobia bacterium]
MRPKTDGSFEFSGAPPATYRLTVNGLPAGYYLKSARLGGVDVLDAGVSLDSTNPGLLDVVLASPGGTISGEVREGGQVAVGVVYVAPEPLRPNRPDLFFSRSTNDDGTFTFAGMPPGNYRLFAFREPDPNLLSNPALFLPYEAKSESVSVDDGASQSVQLELISASAER